MEIHFFGDKIIIFIFNCFNLSFNRSLYLFIYLNETILNNFFNYKVKSLKISPSSNFSNEQLKEKLLILFKLILQKIEWIIQEDEISILSKEKQIMKESEKDE